MLYKFQEPETNQNHHSIKSIKKFHRQHTILFILSTLIFSLAQNLYNKNINNNDNSSNNYDNNNNANNNNNNTNNNDNDNNNDNNNNKMITIMQNNNNNVNAK